MRQRRKKQQAIKRTSRKPKPRHKRGPRKPKPMPEKLPAMLASELDLRCKQIRQIRPGKFEKCQAPATGFLPTFGDICDSHRRSGEAIRYATTRRVVVQKAA